MTGYTTALFLHVVGALGLFVALGVEWISVRQLRRAATAEQALAWVGVAGGVARVGMLSMLTLLVSGVYMTATAWGLVAWIIVSLGTILLMAVPAVAISGRRMAAIERGARAETGPASPALRHLLQHQLLWLGIQARLALALAVVFLMTVKPALPGALLAVGVALLLGPAAALPIQGRKRAPAEPLG